MRAFRYRLGAALKGAEHAEQLKQVALASAEEQLHEAVGRLEAIRRAADLAQTRLRALHKGELEVARVHGVVGEVERLGELLEQAARLKSELEIGVAAARGRLLEAAQERRKFERHREELAVQHRRGELSQESKQLDELAMTRFAASGRTGQVR